MKQRVDERNSSLIVNINGNLVRREQARISPFDSAVQGGDAVWEGLRLYDRKIFRLKGHLRRLRESAEALAFESFPTDEDIIEEIRRTLQANGMEDEVHIRLTVTRGEKNTSGMDPRLNQSGPTLIILAEYKPPVYSKAGLNFITSSVRRTPPDCLDPKIHHNNLLPSILAKIEANAAGADAALMLDTRGFIAEAHGAHVFIVRNRKVLTSTTDACPEGITRQTVIELCAEHNVDLGIKNLSLMEAYRADEMFCTGTMGEIAAVTRLDGRKIGNGEPGPMTQQISAWYAAETEEHGYPIFG